jgi:hypothetical protein
VKLRRVSVWRRALVALAVVASLALASSACSSDMELRAKIVDAQSRPLPGALFYAEAYTHDGVFDFAFARAGSGGEVPAAGSPELHVTWRSGAKLALAAFAPGKMPIVVYDQLGRVKADGIEMPLEDLPAKGGSWEPRVAQLSYPFENTPDLAARLRRSEYQDLRRAFREVYAPLIAGEQPAILPAERVKIEAIKRLDAEAGAAER